MGKNDVTTEPKYTIGIAASRLDISVHALRLYETEGLIMTYKTDTNRRIYSDLEIEKVKCIKNMIHNEGLNFAGIRRVLALVPCWYIKKCDTDQGRNCSAYKNRKYPCWSADDETAEAKGYCRNCIVYKSLIECDDIRQYIREVACKKG